VLGGSEGLVFAWSGRAATSGDYGGATLAGAGVGAALDVASENLRILTSSAPASAGFSAWGAWMGSFAGAMAARDAHEVVLGGLLGANAGLLGGQLLLRTDLVEPSDFGWLSLAGALGTVAGAAVGAPLSNSTNPTPVLAGLAAGPAVGMLAGALVLPTLRRLGAGRGAIAIATATAQPEAEAASVRTMPSPVVCGTGYMAMRADGAGAGAGMRAPHAAAPASETAPGRPLLSVDVLGDGPSHRRDLARLVKSVVQITDWAPMIGALPVGNAADAPAAPPMTIGVTGLWK